MGLLHIISIAKTAFKKIGAIKSDSHLPKKFVALFASLKSPLKKIKNASYFILKALFVLNIFKFLSWLFGHVEKVAWLEK